MEAEGYVRYDRNIMLSSNTSQLEDIRLSSIATSLVTPFPATAAELPTTTSNTISSPIAPAIVQVASTATTAPTPLRETEPTSSPEPTFVDLYKSGEDLIATIVTVDGHSVILHQFNGPYLGDYGSDCCLRLIRGSVKREIPYREMLKIEFDDTADPKHDRPVITLRDGRIVKLERDETATYTGAIFSGPDAHGKDKDGIDIDIPMTQIRSIEFRIE